MFCLLAILGLGRCLDHVPTRQEIEASINRTIEEVERKIQADPSLPRLSRQQIVDILRNVTTQDLDSGDNKTLEKTRNEYQRALMVVLPYNSNGAHDNLEDLYTKPPLVQMISDDDEANENGQRTFEFTPNDPHPYVKQTSDNLISTDPTPDPSKPSLSIEEYQKNKKEQLEATLDSKPERFSFDLEKLGKNPATTQRPIRTWKPILKKITTSPTTNDLYNTNLHTTETPSSKYTPHVLASNQWHYHAPPSTTQKSRYPFPETAFFPPTIPSSNEQKGDQKKETEKQEITTEKFKESDVMSFAMMQTERPSPVYVTPRNGSKSKPSHTLTTGEILLTTPAPMRKEVMDLLETIGLRPMKNTESKVNDLTFDKNVLEARFPIPGGNKVVYNQVSGLTTADVGTPSIFNHNAFESSEIKFNNGVNNLTPAIQLLFKKFGIKAPSNKEASNTISTTTVRTTSPSYNSYKNFKPLPNYSVQDNDMKDFLARFGLGETRNQKALKSKKNTREEPPSLIEAVPENMKQILENIGLITRNRERNVDNLKKEVKPTVNTKFHVFKPHEISVFNDQQKSKINELIETVKKVQQGKADVEEVQKVADEVLETTKSLPDGPDPASLEEILKLYKEDLRNEVKRQQGAENYKKDVKEEKKDNKEEKGQEKSTFSLVYDNI